MKPIQIVRARTALNDLSNCVFPYKVSREIYLLKKQLLDEFNVIIEMEHTLVNKYGGNQSGVTYEFSSPEKAAEFRKEYDAFMQEENKDITLNTIDLSTYSSSINISVSAIEALEGIIKFDGD